MRAVSEAEEFRVVGNMGDWRSQFPILSTTTQTPPKTLVRRVLLFSETMRVVLSYPPKVAFNKPSCTRTTSDERW